jgi:hypothetical protein
MFSTSNLTQPGFHNSYAVRSRLTVNGVRQRFSPHVETALRELDAVGTAVLAILRPEIALTRQEIIHACRDYLQEQITPHSLTDNHPQPTDADIAIVTLRLVELGVAELIANQAAASKSG